MVDLISKTAISNWSEIDKNGGHPEAKMHKTRKKNDNSEAKDFLDLVNKRENRWLDIS